MYLATVLLHRTEKEFWRMTPRKLSALSKAHATANGADESDDRPKRKSKESHGYIDQLW